MTEQNSEGRKPNSPTKEDGANPQNSGNAGTQPGSNQLESQIKVLNEKVEKLTQQYTGSSEEALRLKEERDKLADQVKSLEEQVNSSSRDLDGSFQRTWEQNPIEAVNKLVENKVSDLSKKVDALLGSNAKSVFNRFKSQHPGLDGETLAAFNTKLEQLKPIYSNLDEAMQDAYKLVGGLDADAKAIEAAKQNQQTETAQQQSQQQKEAMINQVSEKGNQSQDRNRITDQTSELRKKLSRLESQHYQNSLLGRTDVNLMVEIKKMKAEINKLTQSAQT